MTVLIPVNISFVEWSGQIRNSFPTQDIPRVSSEKEWINFPDMLSSNRCFEDFFIPRIEGFNNWRDWAEEFILSIGA